MFLVDETAVYSTFMIPLTDISKSVSFIFLFKKVFCVLRRSEDLSLMYIGHQVG